VTHFLRRLLILLSAIVGVAAVAGCGSSGGAATGATGGAGSTTARPSFSQLVRFSSCMRASGVPNFPDPSAGGGLAIRPGSGLNPSSPAFQAAQKRCAKLMPGGFKAGPGKPTKAEFERALAFAKCVRAHGLRDFPDPLASSPRGRGPVLALQGMMFVPGPGFVPWSPAFRRAASQCGVRLPAGPAHP
jgi:hypothetical protein